MGMSDEKQETPVEETEGNEQDAAARAMKPSSLLSRASDRAERPGFRSQANTRSKNQKKKKKRRKR